MIIKREMGIQVLSKVLFPVTPVTIYQFTFLCDGVLIFGGHQEVLDGDASFEMTFYPMFTANVLRTLTEFSVLRQYHVYIAFVVFRCDVSVGVFSVVCVIVFKPIESPIVIIASLKSPSYVPPPFVVVVA